MKKLIYYLLVCVMFFASCKSSSTYDPTKLGSNDRSFAIETMQKIITALDEEKTEALAELFSEEAKRNYDITGQIKAAMEYYKGKSISTVENVTSCGNKTTHIKDGSYKYKSIQFMLLNMETDAEKSYSFDVTYVLVDDEPSCVGISAIYFRDPEDNNGYVLAIGANLKK